MRTLIPIIIYLLVPFAGVLTYLKIYNDMAKKEIAYAPTIPIFILFFAYGGWLVFLLTILFWELSGAAYLGFFVLILPVPLLLFGCAIWLFKHREESKYHTVSLALTLLYLPAAAAFWILTLLSISKK